MATISKSLSTKKDGNGYSQIMFRVTVSRVVRIRLKSGIFIPENRWKNETISIPRMAGAERDDMTNKQTRLIDLEARVLKLCEIASNYLTKEWLEEALILCVDIPAVDLTATRIKERLDQKNNPEKYVKKSIFEHIDDYLIKCKFSDVREKNFRVLVRALKRYEMFVRLSEDKFFALDIDTMDSDTMRDFESYLRNEHSLYKDHPNIFKKIPSNIDTRRKSPKPQPRGNNTICALFNKLRAFFNWCNDQGITENRPFKGYEGLTEKYGNPYYLTLQERNHIADFDLSDCPALEAQRDIFIFQCCIGCRVSDLMKMTKSNIIDNMVEYIPRKTKDKNPVVVRVPLNDRAKKLVEKYNNTDTGKMLFPFICEQDYNRRIKDVFTACGVTRSVTVMDSVTGEEKQVPLNEVASSHMARRTFVGNLYKQVQDPNLISSLSGHKEGSRAFSRYRSIDDDLKKKTVSLIN